ncbi:hypothetical protein [Flagellimonas sp.]|uniref:hypothetical protein n=1 Tax=Flagellimonas sp. TaxID=2058762 RepID=UPI003BAF852D
MKYSIITLLLSVFTLSGFAQTSNATIQGKMLKNVLQEKVFVQTNESLLFSGEYLRYKLYCLETQGRRLTNISKIAYVALVDQDGESVFTHKIRLTDGAGYGDFFVPTSIPTGSYKLLGYSQWMQNFGTDSFFQSDIHIINPYQPVPESYLAAEPDSTQATPLIPAPRVLEVPMTSTEGGVKVSLDKNELGAREKLMVRIDADNSESKNGNYSISIRKLEDLSAPKKMSATEFTKRYLNGGSNSGINSQKVDLPELRGEVVSGTIVNKETKTPVQDVRVSISLPGDKYLFKVASTNERGRFRFLFDQEYSNVTGALQILADNWDAYKIVMDEAPKKYVGIQVDDFKISRAMEDYILQKSIQNQIENGFREVKSDSVIPASHEQPYYRKFSVNYNLDDYTRFNTIEETIIEVVDQLSVRRLQNGDRAFEIRPEEGFTDLALLPMVFVDGLFIKKHEDFMDFSAKKIQTIEFSRDKVILGPHVFQGVLHFKTIEGGFYNDFFTPHIVNVDLFKPQVRKDHFKQTYNTNDLQNRVPDFRHQLLWEPELDLSKGSEEIVLYTSDVPGTYQLILEGFSSIGNPVSVKREFTVK